jgi:hypothetical protein
VYCPVAGTVAGGFPSPAFESESLLAWAKPGTVQNIASAKHAVKVLIAVIRLLPFELTDRLLWSETLEYGAGRSREVLGFSSAWRAEVACDERATRSL